MKALERVLVILIVLLLIVKLVLGNVDELLFMTLSLLTIYYWCFGFYLLNNLTFRHIFRRSTYIHISTLRIIGSIGASMFLSILVLGILFRLVQYEGNVNLMALGLISVAIVIVVSLIKYKIYKDQFYLDLVFKFAHWGVLGLIIYALYF